VIAKCTLETGLIVAKEACAREGAVGEHLSKGNMP